MGWSINLLSCPVCGKQPSIATCRGKKSPEKHMLFCPSCYYFREVDVGTQGFDSLKDAMIDWNKVVENYVSSQREN